MEYDYVIVGSGLFGSTFAHAMKQAGKSCLIIDKRTHSGGNVWCKDVNGIQVHQYGAHIFHTSDLAIWEFVNQFVKMKPFEHSPKANYKGKMYSLPFNMHTFEQLWGISNPADAEAKLALETAPYKKDKPVNLEQQALQLVGPELYETLIKHYTQKQWGKACNELPPFLITRIPLRLTYNNNYFADTYQGIPEGGYNPLINGLTHGIGIELNVDYFANRDYWNQKAKHIVYTGPIDSYFDYCFGKLEYRSLRFEHQLMEGVSDFQQYAVVNYTSAEVPYTRTIEHKHFDPKPTSDTVVTYEYPQSYNTNVEPYYPVNDVVNNTRYRQYRDLAKTEPRLIVGGRLADYQYYDMHQVIASALHKAQKHLQHEA